MGKNKKKRAVTLIEIMIVIVLIGLIGGALAFNMRGSVDKGRIFKTNQHCEQVYNALMMACAEGGFDVSEYTNKKKIEEIVKKNPLIKNPQSVLKDAWGKTLEYELKNQDELVVFSSKLRALEARH